MEMQFFRYAELSSPCWIETTATPDRITASGCHRLPVRVVARQNGEDVFTPLRGPPGGTFRHGKEEGARPLPPVGRPSRSPALAPGRPKEAGTGHAERRVAARTTVRPVRRS
ncbi:hypothetical protein [Streptomyces sp. NPDC008265]|uniref:hypothetical protein n=1 Tax=Streptomyces sp. NPDC008265 TaxID=3364824 RepID=UPI0036E00299